MPIFNGVDNIANIYHGNNQIVKVYQGANLKYELSLFGLYEEIADVIVTSNTTQIDFNNLNITKNDELRLVFTAVGISNVSGTRFYIYPNDEFNTSNPTAINSNYTHQRLFSTGSTIIKNRTSINELVIARLTIDKCSGFADIRISNNDKFVCQIQSLVDVGSSSDELAQDTKNLIYNNSISSINKISIVGSQTNGIGVGTRLQLYKAVK